jgi:hypothetical protein
MPVLFFRAIDNVGDRQLSYYFFYIAENKIVFWIWQWLGKYDLRTFQDGLKKKARSSSFGLLKRASQTCEKQKPNRFYITTASDYLQG